MKGVDSKEIEELNRFLLEIEERIESSYRYFSENEVYSKQIISKGSSFEKFMVFASLLSMMFACGMAVLQIFIIRNDLRSKKLY